MALSETAIKRAGSKLHLAIKQPVQDLLRSYPAIPEAETLTPIDLGEVDGERLNSAFPQGPVRRNRRLHDVDLAVANKGVTPLAGCEHAVDGLPPLVSKEPDGAEKRAVERGVARGHDVNSHTLLIDSAKTGTGAGRTSTGVFL